MRRRSISSSTDEFPIDAKSCDQFIRHKSMAISPSRLREAGIRCNMLVHRQNEFVITYPKGYHAGFNLGFNCAESVNFALDNWIEYGRKAKHCQCVSHSVRIDVDKMLEEAEDAVHQAKGVKVAKRQRNKDENGNVLDGGGAKEETPQKPPRKRAKKVEVVGEDGQPATMLLDPIPAYRPHTRTETVDISMDGQRQTADDGQENASALAIADPFAQHKSDSPAKRPIGRPKGRKSNTGAAKVFYPCLFCPSTDTSDRLKVHEPNDFVKRQWRGEGQAMVHIRCAQATPEISMEDAVTEDGTKETWVMGVNDIEKARWKLVSCFPRILVLSRCSSP